MDIKYAKTKLIKSDGTPVPEDEPFFVLRGQDSLAVKAIHRYLMLCKEHGCSDEHLETIAHNSMVIQHWQSQNPDLVKLPD